MISDRDNKKKEYWFISICGNCRETNFITYKVLHEHKFFHDWMDWKN